MNKDTGKQEVLDLTTGSFSTATHTETMESDNKLKSGLYVKGKFSLPDEGYHELALLSRDLPRIYRLKNLTKELNSKYSIFPTPSDDLGVQQKLQDRLLIFLPKISTQYDQVRIKLSGDGTRVGRSRHVVNFPFIFIDEKNASSVTGNHSLAILKTSEKYDEPASSLQDVLSEASNLQTIEYFLGGDWKFLALVCGIDAANSEYSCIWCKCPNRDRWNMDLEWSVTDVSKGTRTIDEITRLAKLTKSMTRYNCSHPPLFHFIPIHHVVIDSLHLFFFTNW